MRRRDFILGGTALVGSSAIATPVKSLLGADRNESSDWKPDGSTARLYVRNGLLAMWDGIENAGWGKHDPSATVWKCLGDNNDVPITGKAYFGENFLYAEMGTALLSKLYQPTEIRTIECLLAGTGSYVWGMTNNVYRGLTYHLGGYDTQNTSNTNNIVIKCNQGNINHIAITKTGNWQTVDSFLNGELYTGTDKYNNYWYCGNGFGASYNGGSKMKFYCARLYTRQLSAEEIAHNYEVDKFRFNI